MVTDLVRLYCRYAPTERGKWWLRRKTTPWLVAQLDTGPWIRVSGVSDFEWSVLEGRETSESHTADEFTQLLAPGQVVIDVGANVGYYALTAASRVGPYGRVVAFEPGPAPAARLRENAALNGLSNLTVVEAAVSDRPGTLRLNLGENSEANSLYDAGPSAVGSVEVQVVALDEHVEGLDRVDLIKIDAEGAEVGVLRGARRLLSGPSAPPLIVEANPVTLRGAGESVASLRAELVSLGYVIERLESMPWRGEVVENWLAAKPSGRADEA
jgi:FkbM family methyltransferase